MPELQTQGGYTGKILRVNLSNGSIIVEKPDDRLKNNLHPRGFLHRDLPHREKREDQQKNDYEP